MSDFELSDGEKTHPLWARLKAHLIEKRTNLLGKLADENLTEQKTAAMRGRIQCLGEIIKYGDDRPQTGD